MIFQLRPYLPSTAPKRMTGRAREGHAQPRVRLSVRQVNISCPPMNSRR
jgi:hypothetical protein